MGEAEWTVALPESWQTAPFRPGFVRLVAEITLPRKRTALAVVALLKDGTNVIALTWPGGQRLARSSPDTDWAIEERFTGRPPGAGEGVLFALWKDCVDSLVHAGQRTREDMAAGRIKTGPAATVMHDPELLEMAYQEYLRRVGDDEPISRELFEIGVEIAAADEVLAGPETGGDDDGH
jgi:hypothetical protein